ncbi:MAG: M23 family metallopeptidase [Clostridiaceae bacterium]|nr:M23 family metallopeptidase [Clostridiaceae bacterium]
MKPYGYRYGNNGRNRLHRNMGILKRFRLILALLLVFIIVWLIYNEKTGGSMDEFFSESPNSFSVIISSIIKEPVLTIDIDGKKYKIEALKDSSELPDSASVKLGAGKNSVMQLIFEKEPETVSTMLYLNDKRVLSTPGQIIRSEELSGDGEYKGVVEAGWENGDSTVYPFTLVVDLPPSLSVSAKEIDPGELLVIRIDNINDDEEIAVTTDLGFQPNAFKYGNQHIILLPVSYNNPSGKVYQIKISLGDREYSYPLTLNDKEFITQYMTIDTKVAASTRNEQSAKEIDDKINPLKPLSDPEPYWEGNFIMPVEGGRVSEKDFGKRRYVNNSPTSYRHNGLDIGHDKGEPVMASNSGRVLLADFLIETGNTVIIEHGFGLKTWYYHMDELNVKTGDWVKKGDVIGKVGSTGFSTGPHLHFSASVNDVWINPITLINDGVPLFMPE